MNPKVVKTLTQLVSQYGATLCRDGPRLRALLNDLCGGARLEINLLVTAIHEGIAQRIADCPDKKIDGMQAEQWVQLLRDHTAMERASAVWAVESWARALGKQVALQAGSEAREDRAAPAKKKGPRGQALWQSPEADEDDVHGAGAGQSAGPRVQVPGAQVPGAQVPGGQALGARVLGSHWFWLLLLLLASNGTLWFWLRTPDWCQYALVSAGVLFVFSLLIMIRYYPAHERIAALIAGEYGSISKNHWFLSWRANKRAQLLDQATATVAVQYPDEFRKYSKFRLLSLLFRVLLFGAIVVGLIYYYNFVN